MKKTINIKSSKLLIESAIKVGDADYDKKLRKRIVDLQRAKNMATTAKQKAEANGQSDLAKKLEDKIGELDDLLATYNADTIEDEDTAGGASATSSDKDDGKDSADATNETENDDKQPGSKDSDNSTESADGAEDSGSDSKDKQDKENKNDPSGESDQEETGDDKGGSRGSGTAPKTSNVDPNKGSDSDNGDDSGDDKEADDAEDNEDSLHSSSSKSNSEGDKNNDSGGADKDSESDESNSEDDSDDGSDSDSNEQSDGKNSQSKTKPSLDHNDGNNNGSSNAQSEYKNPFADEEDIPTGLGGMAGGREPRDATVSETIGLLKTLKSESREGAIAALKDLIAKRKAARGSAVESFRDTDKKNLTEAVKHVRDMTDDEFGDYINGVYDLIDQADDVDYVDDIEARKQKIGQWSHDPLAIQDLQAEDSLELQKDYQKKKARDAAKAKYSNMGTLKDFEMDFYAAINNQIEMVRQEYQSYDEINTEYESEDAIMKADLVKELPAEAIPIVDVYFDVSGSWEEKHIRVGESAIASVKAFEDQGELKINIFYFSNDVDNVSMQHCRDLYGTGTHGWPDVLQNIKATGAKNVLVMTDSDIELLNGSGYGAADAGSLTVEGCVWYLWKDGESSPTCLKKLRGAQGTSQFAFHA